MCLKKIYWLIKKIIIFILFKKKKKFFFITVVSRDSSSIAATYQYPQLILSALFDPLNFYSFVPTDKYLIFCMLSCFHTIYSLDFQIATSPLLS